jgi:hypothetical protein
MGLAGIWTWLGEDIDKLKALREMTKDEEQLKVLDEVIASLESKKGE